MTAPLSRQVSVAACAFTTVVVIVGPTALALASAPAGDPGVTWLSVFLLTSGIVLLEAGLGLSLRYHALGEAQVGWITTGLVAVAVPHVAVSILALVSGTSVPAHQIGAPTRALLLVPIALVGFQCLRATGIDRGMRPVETGLTLGVLIAIVASGVTSIYDGQALPRGLVTTVDGLLALGLSVIAIVLLRGRLLPTRERRWAVTVVLQFGTAFMATALAGAVGVPQLLVVSAVAALVATVSICLITLTLLWDVQESSTERLSLWLNRADEAERAKHHLEEVMHQVRSSVVTLRNASALLCNLDSGDDLGQRRTLETMLGDEASRLAIMIAEESMRETSTSQSTSLDAVVRPVVGLEGALGARVHWVPSGTRALCSPRATAEILRILLANAARHAPGADVHVFTSESEDSAWMFVSDTGSGVDADVASGAFGRGTHGGQSVGSGIGLHIAQTLALEQNGELLLLPSRPGKGATFALRLPPALQPPIVPAQRSPRQDA